MTARGVAVGRAELPWLPRASRRAGAWRRCVTSTLTVSATAQIAAAPARPRRPAAPSPAATTRTSGHVEGDEVAREQVVAAREGEQERNGTGRGDEAQEEGDARADGARGRRGGAVAARRAEPCRVGLGRHGSGRPPRVSAHAIAATAIRPAQRADQRRRRAELAGHQLLREVGDPASQAEVRDEGRVAQVALVDRQRGQRRADRRQCARRRPCRSLARGPARARSPPAPAGTPRSSASAAPAPPTSAHARTPRRPSRSARPNRAATSAAISTSSEYERASCEYQTKNGLNADQRGRDQPAARRVEPLARRHAMRPARRDCSEQCRQRPQPRLAVFRTISPRARRAT